MNVEPFDRPNDERAAAAIAEWLHTEHRKPATLLDVNLALFYGFADGSELEDLLIMMKRRGMLTESGYITSPDYELTDLGAAWLIWGSELVSDA